MRTVGYVKTAEVKDKPAEPNAKTGTQEAETRTETVSKLQRDGKK
jgi:hypothetical protein